MRILDVLNSPWAIQPEKLTEITDIYGRHLKGDKIDIKAIEARAGMPFERKDQGYDVVRGVAIVPVHGVIAKRMNLFHQISGGASTELMARDIDAALSDSDVHSVILDVDSPGGTVDGTTDLGEFVFSRRGSKPIVTLANGVMASAAYWIGAAADQVYIANDTTISGSVGVVATHVDYSEAYKKAGVKVTEIYAGKYKRISSQYNPLSSEGRKDIQSQVDYLYSVFVNTVAKYRGVDTQTVLDDMADGRLFIGRQAVDAGLVDGVITMDALISKLNGAEAPASQKAEGAVEEIRQSKTVLDEHEAQALINVLENDLENKNMDITKGYILDKHPDIAADFRKEGVASVDVTKIEADAKAAGAEAERTRIQSVFAQSMPGHEAIVKKLAFDGHTSGPEAAVEILNAERSRIASAGTAIDQDAGAIDVAASVDTPAASSDADKNAPIEDRCKKKWAADANLRAEFGNDFDSYLAFEEANEGGHVRMLKTGGAS